MRGPLFTCVRACTVHLVGSGYGRCRLRPASGPPTGGAPSIVNSDPRRCEGRNSVGISISVSWPVKCAERGINLCTVNRQKLGWSWGACMHTSSFSSSSSCVFFLSRRLTSQGVPNCPVLCSSFEFTVISQFCPIPKIISPSSLLSSSCFDTTAFTFHN